MRYSCFLRELGCIGLAVAIGLIAQIGWSDEPASDGTLVAQVQPAAKPAPAQEAPAVKPAAPAAKPAAKPPAPPTPSAAATDRQPPLDLLASTLGDTAPGERLAGTPNMFGDSFGFSSQVTFALTPTLNGTADLPLAAGCRRMKIAENDSPLLQDRVFFLYNHFENALNQQINMFPTQTGYSSPVDRYTFGVEKILFGSCWSAELRMPFAGESDFTSPLISTDGGRVGNLSLILKRLLYESDTTAISAGLGIDTPTGSDVELSFLTRDFTLHNDAVHLMPYVGLLRKPSDRLFYQGFLQLDVPTNGNQLEFNSATVGTLNDQTLFYADLSAGYWLLHDPCRGGLTGLASLVELHYTGTLQDADTVSVFPPPGPVTLDFGNPANRVNMMNLTLGLHAEFANRTICRVGGVVPLTTGENRSFDGEVQVQLERRF